MLNNPTPYIPNMGNQVSCQTATTTTGKVILSDGTVQPLDHDHPLSVAELMLDHPQHFVVELQHFPTSRSKVTTNNNNTKPTPLPADHELDSTKVYVMVPMGRMKTTKTAMEIAEKAIGTSETEIKARWFLSLPLVLMKMRCGGAISNDDAVGCHHGFAVEEKKVELELSLAKEEEEEDETRPEFLSRQFSSKRWKPDLDPIEEKVKPNKLQHWLFRARHEDVVINLISCKRRGF